MMKKSKILAVLLSLTMTLTCFHMLMPIVEGIENETEEKQDSNEIQPRVAGDGTNRSDWDVASETSDEIVLSSYIGTLTDIIVPGEIDGKQVYINGATTDNNNSNSTLGRTEFPANIESITFQEVNRKKVKVKNNRLTKLFYNEDGISLTNFDGSGLDTTGVIDMAQMFYGCKNLTNLTGLENWNTGAVTDMAGLFEFCRSLKNLPSLTNWNVSSVTDMSGLFAYCSSLVSLAGLENWDVRSVISMDSLCAYCSSLSNITALTNWTTTSVTNINAMFTDCSNLTDLTPLTGWNVSSVTRMWDIFLRCNKITTLAGLENWTVSNATSLYRVFGGCSSLVDITALKNWNVSNATVMEAMFGGCQNLKDLSPLESWNVSSVENMMDIFSNCISLTDLSPLTNWDTSSLSNMSGMFWNCRNLTFIDLSNWNLNNLTSAYGTFEVSNGSAPLLVISSNEMLKAYDYKAGNRTPVGPTFDANGGKFSNNATMKQGKTTYILENTTTAVDTFIANAIHTIETPTKEGYEFTGWNSSLGRSSDAYNRMVATYHADWKVDVNHPIGNKGKDKVNTSDPTSMMPSIIVLVTTLMAIVWMIKGKKKES